MPAGFGRAGARFVQSVREASAEEGEEAEELYRNLRITFAPNIVPAREKSNSPAPVFLLR